MLPKIYCALLLVHVVNVLSYQDYEKDGGGYGNYLEDDNEATVSHRMKGNAFKSSKQTIKTLSPLEIQKVRGAIKQILSGHKQDRPFSPLPAHEKNEKRSLRDKRIHKPLTVDPSYDNYRFIKRVNDVTDTTDETKSETQTDEIEFSSTTNEPIVVKTEHTETTPPYDKFQYTKTNVDDITNEGDVSKVEMNENVISTTTASLERLLYKTEQTETTLSNENFQFVRTNIDDSQADETKVETESDPAVEFRTDDTMVRSGIREGENDEHISSTVANNEVIDATEGQTTKDNVEPTKAIENKNALSDTTKENPTRSSLDSDVENKDITDEITSKKHPKTEEEDEFNTETESETTTSGKKTRTRRTTTTTTKKPTTTKFQLDVPALLEIIANLTYDYEMNLTDNLNETLLKLSIPTCETPTTTERMGSFIDYDANATGTIVAKMKNYRVQRRQNIEIRSSANKSWPLIVQCCD